MDAIEAVARRLAQVADRRDAARKQDLVAARRELAMRMMKVMTVGEDYPPIRRNEPLYAELRQRLSVLRTAIADHQAQWSAVAIDSDDAAYIASSAAVQAEGRAFMGWVRQVVEALPE
ncbi:hypothetical protein [Sphingomonas aquatica]|nr:hypothetical protein [Sphingobium sp.]